VATVIALTAVAALLATKTHFQFSSTDLTPQVKSQKTLNEVVTAFDLGGTTQLGTYFLFFAKTEVDLVATAERLKENPLVLKVDSAQRLLPPNLADQQKTLKSLDIAAYADDLDFFDRSLAARQNVLTEIRTLEIQSSLIEYAATLNGEIGLGRDVRTLEGQLRKIQEALRTIPVDEARRSVLELEEALRSLDLRLAEVRELPPVETLLRDILRSYPTEISSQFLTPDGRYIIRAQMSPALFQGSNLKDFDRFAASFSDDYFGMPLVIRDLERAMKQDFFLSTLLAVVFIAFIVWRTFRGLRRTLLALSPLVLSYAFMLGGMRLLGIDFNFINITISPLLVGLGVESGVMLLARYDEERGLAPAGAIERAGQTTIVAILTSLFTTMLVFATLLLARTPGLRYLGICAVMGLGFSLFASLVFLPAALSLRRKGPGA
jgi:predicted RND superfamily exporter protein